MSRGRLGLPQVKQAHSPQGKAETAKIQWPSYMSSLTAFVFKVETTRHSPRQAATPSGVQNKESLMVTPAHSLPHPHHLVLLHGCALLSCWYSREIDKGAFVPHKNSSARLFLTGSSQHRQRQWPEVGKNAKRKTGRNQSLRQLQRGSDSPIT